jgi:hypothetical protein
MRWLAIKNCQFNTGSGPATAFPEQSRMLVMVATGIPEITGLMTAYVVSRRPPVQTDMAAKCSSLHTLADNLSQQQTTTP